MQYSENQLPFAALTVEQAGQFIKDIIRRELSAAKTLNPDPPPERDILSTDEALRLLAEHGYPVTKKSLYNLVSRKAVPSARTGRWLVFSRAELTAWVERKTERDTSRTDAALLLAAHARKRNK